MRQRPPALQPSESDLRERRRSVDRERSRQRAFRARLAEADLIPYQSARWCQHQAKVAGAGAGVEYDANVGGAAHVSGILRCAALSVCPRCSPVGRETRAREFDEAAASWLAAGGLVLFVTGTIRHAFTDSLLHSMSAVKDCWSAMWSGRAGQRLSLDLGGPMLNGDGDHRQGHHAAFEVTWGLSAGWHPHVHSALFVAADVQGPVLDRLTQVMRTRWLDLVEAHTGRRPSEAHGFDVRPVRDSSGLSKYLAKVEGGWGIGLELARSDCKKRPGRYSVPELLAAATDGEAWAVEAWCEYENVAHGLHMFSGTAGLRAALGLDDAVTDQEAVIERLPEPADVAMFLPEATYGRLLASSTEHLPRHVLEDAVAGWSDPWPVACRWLRANAPDQSYRFDAVVPELGRVEVYPGRDRAAQARQSAVFALSSPVAVVLARPERPPEHSGRLWSHDGRLLWKDRSRTRVESLLLRAHWLDRRPAPRELVSSP